MNGNNDIEKLFREQFSGFRAEPSPGFWPKLSRKLQWQEFMNFGWDRFNVYYAGVMVVAAGVGLGILLTREPGTEPASQESGQITGQKERPETFLETREAPIHFESFADSLEAGDLSSGTEEKSAVERTVAEKETETPDKGSTDEKLREDMQERGEVIPSVSETGKNPPETLPPVADYHVTPLRGCVPLTVMCVSLSENADEFTWYFGDGGTSKEENPSYIYDEPGTYPLSLQVVNEAGGSVIARDTVRVYARPEAAFEISPENPDLPGEPVFFYNYSRNAVSYLWHFGDGQTSDAFEPLHTYQKAGEYDVLLVAYSEGGCVDSALVTDAFGGDDCHIVFPNAFRPDPGGPTGGYYNPNDPSNTVFHPVYRGVDEYQLRIFNRTGSLVFESDRVEIGWDGYINGTPARQDVYVWKARGTCINGKSFVKHGNLTLIWDRQ